MFSCTIANVSRAVPLTTMVKRPTTLAWAVLTDAKPVSNPHSKTATLAPTTPTHLSLTTNGLTRQPASPTVQMANTYLRQSITYVLIAARVVWHVWEEQTTVLLMVDVNSECFSTMPLSNVYQLAQMVYMATQAVDSVRIVLMDANYVSAHPFSSAQNAVQVHTTQAKNTTRTHSTHNAIRHVLLVTTVKTSFTLVCPATNLAMSVLSTLLTVPAVKTWLVLSITTSTELPVFLHAQMVTSAKSGITLVFNVILIVRSVLVQTNTPALHVVLTTEPTTIWYLELTHAQILVLMASMQTQHLIYAWFAIRTAQLAMEHQKTAQAVSL